MTISNIIGVVNMFYTLLCYISSVLSLLCSVLWVVNNAVPWLTLLFVIVCIGSKFVQLKCPNPKNLFALFGDEALQESPTSVWPVANKGGAYDAPENSAAALKKVHLCL